MFLIMCLVGHRPRIAFYINACMVIAVGCLFYDSTERDFEVVYSHFALGILNPVPSSHFFSLIVCWYWKDFPANNRRWENA